MLVRTLDGASGRRMQGGVTRIEEGEFGIVMGVVAEGDGHRIATLAGAFDVTEARMTVVVEHLARTGSLVVEQDGRVRWDGQTSVADAVSRAVVHHQRDVALATTLVQMMREYADSAACRWRTLGAYFGDPEVDPCGVCDACLASAEAGEGSAGGSDRLAGAGSARPTTGSPPEPASATTRSAKAASKGSRGGG